MIQLVQSRYDPNSKFLNLESLYNDQGCLNVGLNVFQQYSQAPAALLKVISEVCPDVRLIKWFFFLFFYFTYINICRFFYLPSPPFFY